MDITIHSVKKIEVGRIDKSPDYREILVQTSDGEWLKLCLFAKNEKSLNVRKSEKRFLDRD